MSQTNSFVQALLDFSFSEFVTIRLLKFFYGLGLVVSALAALGLLLTSLGGGLTRLVMMLVLAPIGFIVAATLCRVWAELVIVMFKISENTGDTARGVADVVRNTAAPAGSLS